MTKFEMFWNEIPQPVRTVINVALAGAVLVFFGAIITAHGVTDVDWGQVGKNTLDAFFLGLATAVLKAINPIDSAYGVSKTPVDPTPVAEDVLPPEVPYDGPTQDA